MKKKIIIGIALIIAFSLVIGIVYYRNIIKSKVYYDKDFNINTYTSLIDKDQDGIDDQTDILEGVKQYIKTSPKYKSKYYATGYPNDKYGVCTDVVAQGLLKSGYDLMELVNSDIRDNRELYNIDKIDKNIDFRRVRNLKIYFKRHAISLTTDLNKIESWQGGDIVIFKSHIGIISDKRNKKGIPYLIHHANPSQQKYEEDVLKRYENDIVGHYRIS